MCIRIVEDEHKIARAIKYQVQKESFAVAISYGSDDNLAIATKPYDPMIIARMLPLIRAHHN